MLIAVWVGCGGVLTLKQLSEKIRDGRHGV